MQAKIPTLGAITVDLPPGYEARPNPQMPGVLYFDEQNRHVGSHVADCDAIRRYIWIQYNRRQDLPQPPAEAAPERRSQAKRRAK
jgi:hypothetical protein